MTLRFVRWHLHRLALIDSTLFKLSSHLSIPVLTQASTSPRHHKLLCNGCRNPPMVLEGRRCPHEPPFVLLRSEGPLPPPLASPRPSALRRLLLIPHCYVPLRGEVLLKRTLYVPINK